MQKEHEKTLELGRQQINEQNLSSIETGELHAKIENLLEVRSLVFLNIF